MSELYKQKEVKCTLPHIVGNFDGIKLSGIAIGENFFMKNLMYLPCVTGCFGGEN